MSGLSDRFGDLLLTSLEILSALFVFALGALVLLAIVLYILDVTPFHLETGCDLVFQVGTAKNGVRDLEGNLDEMRLKEVAAHEQVRLFEIKLSQGAKPGKGGMLPGEKVTAEIAKVRGIRTGENAFSPNRHRDIASNADLLEMIERIRTITGKPVGFKTVLGGGAWLDSLFTDIEQRGAAAAPDFITSARSFMFALGCIQAMQCNKNTCPTGITTHDPKLQCGLFPPDKAERVAGYARNMTYEVGLITHACGARSPRDLTRAHCRVVQANGLSIPLEELHAPVPRPTDLGKAT